MSSVTLSTIRTLAPLPLAIGAITLADWWWGAKIPNVPGLLLVPLAYSAYSGGLAIGLISAAMHMAYSVVFFSPAGHLLHYDTKNLVRVIVITVVAPAMATMLGTLRRKADRSLRQLKQAERDLLQLNTELEQRIKERTAELTKMARHDGLTGIANRAVLHEKLQKAAVRLRAGGEAFSVLMLDLDGFKYINDSAGHDVGDQLLRGVAHRLQTALGGNERVARLGGDEFAIVQRARDNQRERAIALALKILDVIAKPFNINGHEVSVGASIGIAVAPENGSEPSDLLKKADLALYRVKAQGRNSYSFYDEEMSKDASMRHRLLCDLRTALARREFELHYQPVFDAKTAQPCGVEALVRWRHPVDGLIYPDRFIWLAEEAGLMEQLGEWILEQACTDATTWPDHIKVAVNLSAAQFRTGRLFDVILCALVESGLDPERLELEITESVLLQNNESYDVMIQQLKNIGAAIVLDDFGTGYSSLGYVTRFSFDKIKIDKSFTQGLLDRADCAAVVASVLTLARGLNIAVNAEGVETKEQFELLRAAGVDQVQGYFFSRPRPLAELDFSALEQKAEAAA
jgi:diguanylate cyclase (GGDEF)-like protein